MKTVKFIMIAMMIVILSLIVLDKFEKDIESSYLREDIFHYLTIEENQESTFANAMALNYGNSENSCVYFVSEVLRQNGYYIPEETANITQLVSILEGKGWSKDSNFKNLKPGDICFTTDYTGSKTGVPTHTYVFMGWVEEGSYDYAYICDNQAKDYDNEIYHVRNIEDRVEIDGLTKDAFSFFMKI